MDSKLLERLLNEDESATLDFKQGQYPFAKATQDQKSELLKDILAFANAWRRTEAYILIGVAEVYGGRGNVIGVADHLPEASLQQFVNSKINRPLDFTYEVVPIDGVHVGVIQIPVQERPFFLEKGFGKLAAQLVYLRRGSSTAVADPDEIARMRVHTDRQSPQLSLVFAEANSHLALGPSINSRLSAFSIPDSTRFKEYHYLSSSYYVNKDYYRKYASCLSLRSALLPIRFIVQNLGKMLVNRARMLIRVDTDTTIAFREEHGYPRRPIKGFDLSIPINDSASASEVPPDVLGQVDIVEKDKYWEISIMLGDIQPKATAVSDTFYIYSKDLVNCVADLDALLYMDEGEPLKIQLAISLIYDLTPLSNQATLDQLIESSEQQEKKRRREEFEELEKRFGYS